MMRSVQMTMTASLAATALLLGGATESRALRCGPARPPGDYQFFHHPEKAKTLELGLVQAFAPCLAPTTTTEGGASACLPETPNEAAGNPTDGWRWSESASYGRVRITAVCPNARDLDVRFELGGIVDGNGAPANGTGTLDLSARATVDDPVGGKMTAIDFPITTNVTVTGGRAKLRTTASAMLAGAGLPPIPNATSLEISRPFRVDVDPYMLEVRDGNDTVFARPGLSTAGGATCDVPHPTVSKDVRVSLVQGYVPCDPMAADVTTEGGTPACSAPHPYYEDLVGPPGDGWIWGARHNLGTVRLQPRAKPVCLGTGTDLPPACAGASNPADDTSDVIVTVTIRGVRHLDQAIPPNGTGSVVITMRGTIDDRVGGPLTMEDVPIVIPFTLQEGKATVKSSFNAALNASGHPGFPACATSEVALITVLDENGTVFGSAGAWLP